MSNFIGFLHYSARKYLNFQTFEKNVNLSKCKFRKNCHVSPANKLWKWAIYLRQS